MDAPIPTPRDDDDEDVHWALSTAGALWNRGERAEALKWLRRAAEQASDMNADLRSLELFKAAAELTPQAAAQPSAPAPPAPPAPARAVPQGPAAAPQAQRQPPQTPAPPAASPRPVTVGSPQGLPQTPAVAVVIGNPPGAPTAGPRPLPVPARTVGNPQAAPQNPLGAGGNAAPVRGTASVPPPRPLSTTNIPIPPPIASARGSSMSFSPAPPREEAPRSVGPTGTPAPQRLPAVPTGDPQRLREDPSTAGGSQAGRGAAPVPPARSVAINGANVASVSPAPVLPRRRRSFTGESRASAEKPRAADAPRSHRTEPHRTRRRTLDPDSAAQQAPRAQAKPEPDPSAPAREAAPVESPTVPGARFHTAVASVTGDPFAIFDDLDEDTRVQNKPAGGTDDIIRRARERAGDVSAPPPIAADTPIDETTLVGVRPPLAVLERIAAGLAAGNPAGAPQSSPVVATDAQTPSPPETIPGAMAEASRPAAPAVSRPMRPQQRTVLGIGEGVRPGAPASAPRSQRPAEQTSTGAGRPTTGPVSGHYTVREEASDAPPPSPPTSVWGPPKDLESSASQARDPDPEGPVTERPARARAAASRTGARFETLPSLRVAVLATTTPGEVRLITLDPRDDPPPGAAIALLVPLSAGDGDAITKLFTDGGDPRTPAQG